MRGYNPHGHGVSPVMSAGQEGPLHPDARKLTRSLANRYRNVGWQTHPHIDWLWCLPYIKDGWRVYGPDGSEAGRFQTRTIAEAAVELGDLEGGGPWTIRFELDPDQVKRVDEWADRLSRWAHLHRQWEDAYAPCDRWHCREALAVLARWEQDGHSLLEVIEKVEHQWDPPTVGGAA